MEKVCIAHPGSGLSRAKEEPLGQGRPREAACYTADRAAETPSPRNCFVTDFPGAGVTQEAAGGFHGDRHLSLIQRRSGFIPASKSHPHSKRPRRADPWLPASQQYKPLLPSKPRRSQVGCTRAWPVMQRPYKHTQQQATVSCPLHARLFHDTLSGPLQSAEDPSTEHKIQH